MSVASFVVPRSIPGMTFCEFVESNILPHIEPKTAAELGAFYFFIEDLRQAKPGEPFAGDGSVWAEMKQVANGRKDKWSVSGGIHFYKYLEVFI